MHSRTSRLQTKDQLSIFRDDFDSISLNSLSDWNRTVSRFSRPILKVTRWNRFWKLPCSNASWRQWTEPAREIRLKVAVYIQHQVATFFAWDSPYITPSNPITLYCANEHKGMHRILYSDAMHIPAKWWRMNDVGRCQVQGGHSSLQFPKLQNANLPSKRSFTSSSQPLLFRKPGTHTPSL